MNNNMGMFNVSSSNPNMMSISQMKAMMNNNNMQHTQNPQFMGNMNGNNMGNMNGNNNMGNMNGGGRQLNLDALNKPLIITGPTQGTSIASIKGIKPQQNNDNMQYPTNKQIKYPQQNPQMTATNPSSQQGDYRQQPTAYDNVSHGSYKSMGSMDSREDQNNYGDRNNEEINKIRHLVKDINKHLDDYGPSKSQFSDETIDENSDSDKEDSATETEYVKKSYKKKTSSDIIGQSIKECVLLMVIYVLVSQDFIKKSVVTMIPHVLDEANNTTYIGHVTYGTMLAILFVFFKKILL